ncbi:unnamed protein product, partial [marine sediment metagenome]
LPFMFIFNTDLLLIGVYHWWHIGIVFASGVIGMLAFASVTQNYFALRNRLYESVLLALVVLIMLRPELPMGWLGYESKFISYIIGALLYVSIYAMQRWRKL